MAAIKGSLLIFEIANSIFNNRWNATTNLEEEKILKSIQVQYKREPLSWEISFVNFFEMVKPILIKFIV